MGGISAEIGSGRDGEHCRRRPHRVYLDTFTVTRYSGGEDVVDEDEDEDALEIVDVGRVRSRRRP